jgi:hypothetical protein
MIHPALGQCRPSHGPRARDPVTRRFQAQPNCSPPTWRCNQMCTRGIIDVTSPTFWPSNGCPLHWVNEEWLQ